MNIINLNVSKELTTLRAGGGTPKLLVPETLNGLFKIRDELTNIKNSDTNIDEFIIILFHKTKDVPAISNRFCKCMCTIFGNSNFKYEKNKMTDLGLGFHYTVTRYNLDYAILRLNHIIDFMETELKTRTLENWYSNLSEKTNDHEIITNKINRNLRTEIGNISKTSLLELLSKSESNYNFIVHDADNIEIHGEKNILCSFINKKYTDQAKIKLNQENINISYTGDNLLEISVPNDKVIKLSGLMNKPKGYSTISIRNQQKNELSDEECLFPILENNIETNNVAVGVIDGGINSSSIILRKINYKTFKDLGIEEKQNYVNNDNHAEKVVSMLLWANKFSERTNDNCRQPKITLFDIVRDGMSSGEFLDAIEIILQKYHKEIKIWNISVIFDNFRNDKSWRSGVTHVAVEIDKLQKKYDVLFVLATGNVNDNNDNRYICTPSDSIRGISVACCLQNGLKTEYSLNGQCTENLYYVSKPDLATSGCDADGNYKLISDNFYTLDQGVSFAVPLIVRKVAELYSRKIELNMIPAILDCIACHNSNKLDDYLGYGVLPMDINEILELKKSNALILFTVNPADYSQGFFKLKLPKDENGNYPFSFTFGVNVEANTSDNSCFEYVEDSARIQIGAVDPSATNNRILQHTKIQIVSGDDDDAYTNDDSLRRFFGKYKNRYCCKKIARRAMHGTNGTSKIEYFGVTITRNDIRSKRYGDLKTHICLLINSINNMDIYDEIININRNLIDIEIAVNDTDNIRFE